MKAPVRVHQGIKMNQLIKTKDTTMYYYKQEILDGNDKLSKHFSVKEIACKCCGLVYLAKGFISKLECLREAVGFPLTLTSACRCPKHNKSEGGRKGSFHLTANPKYSVNGTCAVDVAWGNWSEVKKECLLRVAVDQGWSTGKANTFCHLDIRAEYTYKNRVDFIYDGYTGV